MKSELLNISLILDEDIIWFGNIFSDIIVVDSRINSRMLIQTKPTMAWRENNTNNDNSLAVWLFDNNAESRCSNRIVGFKPDQYPTAAYRHIRELFWWESENCQTTTFPTAFICLPWMSPREACRFAYLRPPETWSEVSL
jgi:hypothetical protein